MAIEPPDKMVHPGYRSIPVMFPEYGIVPHIWNNKMGRMEPVSLSVYDLYLAGMDTNAAMAMMEKGEGMSDEEMMEKLAEDKAEQKSQMMKVAQGEQYNLAVGVYTGAVEAAKRVKSIPRTQAEIDITAMLKDADVSTVDGAVDYFARRFLSVPLSAERRAAIESFASDALGGASIDFDAADVESALRRVVHLVLSAPEYQLA